MKILSIVAIIISLVAASFSAYLHHALSTKNLLDNALKPSPQALMDATYKGKGIFGFSAEGVFRDRHRTEIAQSVVASDILTSSDDNIALVLIRYEAAGKQFHDSLWARKFANSWIQDYVSSYSENDKILMRNKDWIEKAKVAETNWKKTSPSIYDVLAGE